MKRLTYGKIGERTEQVPVYHEAEYDELGNLVKDAYEELVDKVVPIMGAIYEEMTQEEIDEMEKQEELPCIPTLEERVEAVENAMVEMIMGVCRID